VSGAHAPSAVQERGEGRGDGEPKEAPPDAGANRSQDAKTSQDASARAPSERKQDGGGSSSFIGWLQQERTQENGEGRSWSVDIGSLMSKQEVSRVHGRGAGEPIGYLQALRLKPGSTMKSKRRSTPEGLYDAHPPGGACSLGSVQLRGLEVGIRGRVFPRLPSHERSSDLGPFGGKGLGGMPQPTFAQQRSGTPLPNPADHVPVACFADPFFFKSVVNWLNCLVFFPLLLSFVAIAIELTS
jgi:hypothetical protein